MLTHAALLSTGKIKDEHIAQIAEELQQWQIVASNLGFGQKGIEDIETDHRRPADQRMAFLRKWIARDGNAATYEKLSEVLEGLGKQGAAERILQIAQRK